MARKKGKEGRNASEQMYKEGEKDKKEEGKIRKGTI